MSTITISNRTITTALFLTAGVVLFYLLREILVLLFVAVVLSSAMNQSIEVLTSRGLNRRWALVIVGVGVAGVLTLISLTIVPAVSHQVSLLLTAAPSIIGRLVSGSSVATFLTNHLPSSSTSGLNDAVSGLGSSIFHGALSFLGGILVVISVMVMTYYLIRDHQAIRSVVASVVPKRHRQLAAMIVEQIEQRLGHWLRGQLLLGLIIGLASTGGLLLLHVNYAVALGLIAGLTELIPNIGPYFGMIPAALVGWSQSPLTAVWVIGLYWVIQQLENNFLVPRIMSKATGLSPIAVLIGILIGAKLGGILGILLAVPSVIIISTISNALLTERAEAIT